MPSLDLNALNDFALPARRLFPCDTPVLTNASAMAFDKEASKLPAREKIAAARHITKRANALGVPVHASLAARIAGNEISDMFKVALFSRKEVCAWHPKALTELDALARMGDLITKQASETRPPLLDMLAEKIEAFDANWDKAGVWREYGVPDAVETVFAKAAAEVGVVRVGAREVRARDLTSFDKEAASKALSPDALKAAESMEAFVMASDDTRAAIVAFMPVVRA